MTVSPDGAPSPQSDADRRSRRDRLKDLKARRASGGKLSVPPPAEQAENAPAENENAAFGIMAQLSNRGTEEFKARRKVVMNLYKRLTSQPRGGSPIIEDTPFSEAGVSAVMAKLRERAANESAKGAKVAGGLITFLSPDSPDDASISGASIERLKQLSRLVTRYKSHPASKDRGQG